jgi:putative membrane protein
MFDGLDTSWSFEPVVLTSLAAYLVLYTLRWRRSRRQGGPRAAPVGKLVLWWTGIAALVVALVSPVGALGEQLASAHMVQHLLIADIAAICLTLALTRHILRPVTRQIQHLEQRAGVLAHPAFGAAAYIGVMLFWHVPFFYDAAVEHDAVHTAEHLSFAAAGLLYWWHLLSPIRSRLRLRGLAPVAYMAGTKIAVGIVGIALAFSPELLYTAYEFDGARLGMSALDDQNVAGLIMALEQSIVMGIALAWLFVRMLGESEREEERAERYERV